MEIEPDRPWWRSELTDGAGSTTAWLLSVRVQPGASRTGVVGPTGVDGGELKIRLASPPVDGRANEELLHWLAKEVGVPKSAVTLVRGQTSRSKVVRIDLSARRG
ncbi:MULTISPECIES: DUF167 domain-containing protein [unclassified Nocardioides]|uniref:DUF167 domain-containing protein n=1 Tax=unclassified Nocardioides TaxID=2615069 RepID=UPI000A646BCE|nr:MULTISPECIES: DUF167 domain-containing protein [unclassified Nocardioides]